jgi:hypothetical protein
MAKSLQCARQYISPRYRNSGQNATRSKTYKKFNKMNAGSVKKGKLYKTIMLWEMKENPWIAILHISFNS